MMTPTREPSNFDGVEIQPGLTLGNGVQHTLVAIAAASNS